MFDKNQLENFIKKTKENLDNMTQKMEDVDAKNIINDLLKKSVSNSDEKQQINNEEQEKSKQILKELIEKSKNNKSDDENVSVEDILKDVIKDSNQESKPSENSVKDDLSQKVTEAKNSFISQYEKISKIIIDLSKDEKIKMILALVNLKPENSEKNQIKKDLNILSNSELRTILFALISYLFKAGRYKFVWGIIGTGLAYQAYQMWNKSTKKEDSDSTTKVKAETSVNEKDKDIMATPEEIEKYKQEREARKKARQDKE